MRLRLTTEDKRILDAIAHKQRVKLENGQVFCHRCSGFRLTSTDLDSAGCLVCDGKGWLKRERFGVVNGLNQNLEANDSLVFMNGMDEQGRSALARLNRYEDEKGYSRKGQISIFEVSSSVSDGHSRTSHSQTREAFYAHDPTTIECRMPIALPEAAEGAQPPSEVMVMPGGVHQITASQGGKPVTVTVQVGPDSAAALQRSLREHLAAGPQRPYFDFDHNGGQASAWPLEFVWRGGDRPLGVYARVEWSKAGSDAITGKMYRAFSPGFHVDDPTANPAKVTGAPLNMGSLVNNPAFKKISPLWAKQASEGANQSMTTEELAALQARLAKLENENAELRAQQANSANTATIEAKDEEIKQLNQALAKVQGEIKARNLATAKAAVLAAVKRGALPPKDTAIQAQWEEILASDPTKEVLLASMQGNPALTPITAASGARDNDALHASVTITREDSQQVLLAYASARDEKGRGAIEDAKARAAIYASDISPRLRKKEAFPLVLNTQMAARVPVHASNSLSTLAGDVVTQRVLELLMTTFPQLQRISANLSGETALWNNTVKVNLVAPPALTSYVAGTGYSRSNATVTQATITLNNHKAIEIAFNTEELGSTNRRLFEEQAPLQAYVLGKALVTALYGNILVANFPKTATYPTANPITNETVVTLANFSRTGVMKLGRALTDREVPDVMRMLILRGDYYDKLGEDTVIVSAFNNPGASDVIQSGVLPDVHGFGVADAKILPVVENLQGFACFPSALALATRLPDDYTKILPGVNGGAVTKIITEPNTGISLLNVQYVDHVKAEAASRYAFMYGTAVGDPAAGQRLVNTATA